MPKHRRRSFTSQFKAQVVFEVLTGLKIPPELAGQHKLKPELITRWKEIVLEGLETLFQSGGASTGNPDVGVADVLATGALGPGFLEPTPSPHTGGPGPAPVNRRMLGRALEWR